MFHKPLLHGRASGNAASPIVELDNQVADHGLWRFCSSTPVSGASGAWTISRGDVGGSLRTANSRVQCWFEDVQKYFSVAAGIQAAGARTDANKVDPADGAPGKTPHDDLAKGSDDKKVVVALLSGKDCECLWLQDRTIRQLKEEAQQKLDIAIKNLIGPNMELLDEEKMFAEENIVPGTTLTVVAVDQKAEDEKEAAECRDIFEATRLGRVGAVRHFLRLEPSAVASTQFGATVLHYAACEGQVAVGQVLLAAGAELDARNVDGQTPLHYAALNGHVDALKLLLEAKASVTAEDINGRTPLDDARSEGHKEVMKILESADAGKTPHDLSKDGDDKKVFVALLSGKDCECLWLQDRTIRQLKEEAQQKLDIAIKNLIGPNMELLDEEKMLAEENIVPGTTLTVVVAAEDDEKEAATCGNDIILAAYDGKLGAVRHLLRTEPDAVTKKSSADGGTALHRAALRGHAEICRVLLAAKAEVDARTYSDGNTPLHLAAFNGHVEVVKLLLEARASVIVEDNKGNNPLDDAISKGHDEIVTMLVRSLKLQRLVQ
eukprot:s3074_g8.t1